VREAQVNADRFDGRRAAPRRTEMIHVKTSRMLHWSDSFSRGSSPPARWPASPANPSNRGALCLCGSVVSYVDGAA